MKCQLERGEKQLFHFFFDFSTNSWRSTLPSGDFNGVFDEHSSDFFFFPLFFLARPTITACQLGKVSSLSTLCIQMAKCWFNFNFSINTATFLRWNDVYVLVGSILFGIFVSCEFDLLPLFYGGGVFLCLFFGPLLPEWRLGMRTCSVRLGWKPKVESQMCIEALLRGSHLVHSV